MYICEDKKGRESTLVLEGFKKKKKRKTRCCPVVLPDPLSSIGFPLSYFVPLVNLF